MMVAIGTDVKSGDQVTMENHLSTAAAFAPEIVRRVALFEYVLDFRPNDIANPVHFILPTLKTDTLI